MDEKKYDNQELCAKIKDVFPDIGECGIDIDVDYDDDQKAYIVNMKKGQRKIKTHLETEDADTCMLGKQCLGLGIQIAQFKD
jgi:beta-xylosidase